MKPRLVWRCGTVWLASLAALDAVAAIQITQLSVTEPRAFGYQVGDLVTRRVTLDAPAGLALDAGSLPQTGRRGTAIELRRLAWHSTNDGAGKRYEIELEYQIFAAPREVRTLELPVLHLRLEGQPRAEERPQADDIRRPPPKGVESSGKATSTQEVRVDAWPVTVAPLVPVEVSPRRGLGELQPDAPAPLIDTSALRLRLIVWGVVAALLLGYLAHVYLGLPWWARRGLPFTQAWQALRALSATPSAEQRREAFRRVHEALNRTAGKVVFEPGVDAFLAAEPKFVRLRDDLRCFFSASHREFFGTVEGDAPGAATVDGRWLREFCRRCRDVERGAA